MLPIISALLACVAGLFRSRASRIVGELRKVGIDVAKSTVEKDRVRPQRPPSPTWKTFLNQHIKDLVSLDFFVVPTVTYKVLFVLVILAHERRQVIHCNVTEHPTAEWTAQRSWTPSHGMRPRAISCATAMASTGPHFGSGCGTWGLKKSSSPRGVRGRTPMWSGSSGTSVASAWIT
jgi:hypothetical protein